mmetsp:Transcript_134112/g.388216  ORF Transcript_134112/g.388216 Transcript_134112/m.388216 type:complete len:250 (-) Transcript_134112:655-1404(-)
MRFTDAPTIWTPFIFESCVFSRMARDTIGKMRPKEQESTVFINVVLDIWCNAVAALSMLALSRMLLMIASAIDRISGVPATSCPMCRNMTSASFFTSFLASPTASRTAIIIFGIMTPSCFGVCASILWMTSFRRPMQATFTFHLPAAAVPKCARSTGRMSSGTALPVGPPLHNSWHKLVAVPIGSDFSFVSSNNISTAGMDGITAGGAHRSARMVRSAASRVGARFSFAWMPSLPAEIIDGTSHFTSLL